MDELAVVHFYISNHYCGNMIVGTQC